MAAIRVGFGEGFQPAFSTGLPDVTFQSAPPHGGRPIPYLSVELKKVFQSAPPAKGAISVGSAQSTPSVVSIRAPREGGDMAKLDAELEARFQSAPPAKGAIFSVKPDSTLTACFNPRPPRRGRLPSRPLKG